jgi:uncharacterized membrane protein YfhO
METEGFDPLRETLLEQTQDFALAEGPSETRVLSWENTRVVCRLDGRDPGIVVLQKTYLPSWTARLDGQKVPLLRCDGVLIGVPVPLGIHRLELRFEPTGLRLGFFLALLFLGLGGFLSFLRFHPASRRRAA